MSDDPTIEDAALFALLAACCAGSICACDEENDEDWVGERYLAGGLRCVTDLAKLHNNVGLITNLHTKDVETFRPIARRLVALARNAALHEAIAACEAEYVTRGKYYGGDVATQCATRIRKLVDQEPTDAEW